MRYLLPIAIELALLVYCLIDCIQTDSVLVRNLSKTTWVFVIILVPVAGAVAWLVAGRPERRAAGPTVPWPATRTAGFPEYERPASARAPRGPDDDAAFLAGLGSGDREQEEILRRWEAQLRERERRLSDAQPSGASASEPSAEPDADAAPPTAR